MRAQQVVLEDEITSYVANHKKLANESFYKTSLNYEKRLFDMNRTNREMEEKLNSLERETDHKVNQCIELQNLLKTYKGKLNETQQVVEENRLMYAQNEERMRKRYEKRIKELEDELKDKEKGENTTGTELMQKLEQLKKSLDRDDQIRKSSSSTELVFMTANASFHEPNDEAESVHETSIGTLIEKIDKLLRKDGEISVSAYEKQVEKLEKELTAVREQSIIDRQSARQAHLSLWKLEKQVSELENEKKTLTRRYDYANDKVKGMKEEVDACQLKLQNTKELVSVKDNVIKDLHQTIRDLKNDRQLERNIRINYEKECMRQKSEVLEHLAKIKSLEEMLESNTKMLNEVQQKNDDLISQQNKMRYELEQRLNTCTLATTITADKNRELTTLHRNYEMLKKACSITDKQITELESKLKAEDATKRIDQKKIKELQTELSKRNNELHLMRRELTEIKDVKQRAEENVEKFKEENDQIKHVREIQTDQALELRKEIKDLTQTAMEHEHRIQTLIDQLQGLQSINHTNEKQIHFLKEDNSRILSDLFLAREEIQALKQQIDDYDLEINNLMHEMNVKEGILLEQKNCQTQADIKATTTIAQCKKLIEHLQYQVSRNKKNKTLAEKILGLESKTPAK